MSPDEKDIFASLDALLDAEAPRSRVAQKRKEAPKPAVTTTQEEDVLCVVCQDDVSFPKGQLPCDHTFCHPCIVEWSKRSNLCPMCKRRFTTLKRISDKGRITTRKIKKKDFADTYDSESIGSSDYNSGEEDGVCMMCGADDNPFKLFYCDTEGCANLQHDYCCVPRLDSVPEEGEFFCTECVNTYNKPSNFIPPPNANNTSARQPVDDKEKEPAPLPPIDRTVPKGAPPIDSTAEADKTTPRMSTISYFQPLDVPYVQPPRNPNASQNLDDYLVPSTNRKVSMLELHTALNRRNLQEIREAWKEQISSLPNASSDKEDRPRLTEEFLKTLPDDNNKIISEWEQSDPTKVKRTLSASEWNKKFGQGSQSQDQLPTTQEVVTPRKSISASEWNKKFGQCSQPELEACADDRQHGSSSDLGTPRRSISASDWNKKFGQPPSQETDPAQTQSSQGRGTPRGSISAAEWSQQFGSPESKKKPAKNSFVERSKTRAGSQIRAKGDRAGKLVTYFKRNKNEIENEAEQLTDEQLANFELMLSDLGNVMRKRKRKRTRSEIYSARGAITAALIIAGSVQKKTLDATSKYKTVDGVPVASELRNTVVRTGKLYLMPFYSSGAISKESFKSILSAVTDRFLLQFVNRHRSRLLSDPYSFHEFLSEDTAGAISILCDKIIKKEKK